MSKEREQKKQLKEIKKRKKRVQKVKKHNELLDKIESRSIASPSNRGKSFRRVFAVMIDWYLASVLAGIPVMFIYSIESGQATTASSLSAMSFKWGMISGILAILAASIYYVYIPVSKYKGQTLGKKLMGIKVVNLDNSDVNFVTMFKREIIGVAIIEGGVVCTSEYMRQMVELASNSEVYAILGIIGSVATIVSVIMLFVTKEKRMLHDYIGQTKVVEVAKDISKDIDITSKDVKDRSKKDIATA